MIGLTLSLILLYYAASRCTVLASSGARCPL